MVAGKLLASVVQQLVSVSSVEARLLACCVLMLCLVGMQLGRAHRDITRELQQLTRAVQAAAAVQQRGAAALCGEAVGQ